MIRLSGAGRLAVMLALLAGCGTGLKTDGPFGRSSTSRIATQCFPVRHNGVGTFGGLSFGNNGGPARIDKVTLVNARHLRIVAAWVVPVTGDDLLGVSTGSRRTEQADSLAPRPKASTGQSANAPKARRYRICQARARSTWCSC